MWRKRILLKLIIEVSEAENKKEINARTTRMVKVNGEEKILYML